MREVGKQPLSNLRQPYQPVVVMLQVTVVVGATRPTLWRPSASVLMQTFCWVGWACLVGEESTLQKSR